MEALLEYLVQERGRDYIALVYMQDFAVALEALQAAARGRHPGLHTSEDVLVLLLVKSMRSALRWMKA